MFHDFVYQYTNVHVYKVSIGNSKYDVHNRQTEVKARKLKAWLVNKINT